MTTISPLLQHEDAPAREKVLLALGRYQYLTRPQMQQLGIAKYDRLGEVLRELMGTAGKSKIKTASRNRSKLPLVTKYSPAPAAHGRMADLYCLTKHGASVVSEIMPAPLFHASKMWPTQDYPHRVGTIDTAIALDTGLSQSGASSQMSYYFGRVGAGGTANTTFQRENGKNITPDMLLEIAAPDGRTRWCCVEYYRGTSYREHANKVLAYFDALKEICSILDSDSGVRVLIVCETPALLNKLIGLVHDGMTEKMELNAHSLFFRLAFGCSGSANGLDIKRNWLNINRMAVEPFVFIET